MKKTIAFILSIVMSTGFLVGCLGGNKKVLRVYSFSDEVPNIINKYLEDRGSEYRVERTVVPMNNGGNYETVLDQALVSDAAPDIFAVEAGYVKKYAGGEMADNVLPYKNLGFERINGVTSLEDAIGITFDDAGKVIPNEKGASLAPYTVQYGSNKGTIYGLSYQLASGALVYRKSLALEAYKHIENKEDIDDAQLDDWVESQVCMPKNTETEDQGSNQQLKAWGNFINFASKLQEISSGYKIVSGLGDVWHAATCLANEGWLDVTEDKNGEIIKKLNLPRERTEDFFDLATKLIPYHNGTKEYGGPQWYSDMTSSGGEKVFCYLCPAWLINYTLSPQCVNNGDQLVQKDWRVCRAPVDFIWGGTWIMASKKVEDRDKEKQELVRDIIYWMTLEQEKTGLQYLWATGTSGLSECKDAVASRKIMNMDVVKGELDLLNGQDMFDVYKEAASAIIPDNLSSDDLQIDVYWRECLEAQLLEYKNEWNKHKNDAQWKDSDEEKILRNDCKKKAITNFVENIKNSLNIEQS